MAKDLEQTVLELIETNNAAMEKAAAQIKDLETKNTAYEVERTKTAALNERKAAAAKMFDEVFVELVTHGRTHPTYRDKAAQALEDPLATMELIKRLANPNNLIANAPTPLGTNGTKTASADNPADAPTTGFRMLGAKRPLGERESDKQWYGALNGQG